MNRSALRAAAAAALLPLACAGAHATATATATPAKLPPPPTPAGLLRVETFEGFATGATPNALPALAITRIEPSPVSAT